LTTPMMRMAAMAESHSVFNSFGEALKRSTLDRMVLFFCKVGIFDFT